MTEFVIIVAIAQNNVIGRKNDIPWRLKEDFQHFKEETWGHPCMMGDKTYESLPVKPLPGRENIVLTWDKNYHPVGTTIFFDFNDGIKYCREKKYPKVFITGGAIIYKLGMQVADTFMLTKIHKDYQGETTFPEVNWEEWELIKQEDHQGIDQISGKEIKFSFLTYQRKPK